jgi:hypothetical protein
VNAKDNQKSILRQAEEEFGLVDNRPESVQAEQVMKAKTAIELGIVEEIQSLVNEGQLSGEIGLGFHDGAHGLKDNLEWDIKNTFLDKLVTDGVLVSAERGEAWSDDVLSSIAVIKFSFDSKKSNELQKVINSLALEVKKQGGVRLVEGEVTYNQKTRKIIFNDVECPFDPEFATERFLQHMFQLELQEIVDWGDLYLDVFGDYPHMGRENDEAKKTEIQKLEAIKDSVNRRVKEKINTPDLLFRIKNRQYYRCF